MTSPELMSVDTTALAPDDGPATINGSNDQAVDQYAEKARSAVIWNTGFNLFRDLLQFCQMLLLARLLRPEAYGQFGLISSLIGFLAVFTSKSFVGHALQVRTENEAQFQNHFTAGAFLQIAAFLVANALAILLRFVPKYSEVAPLLHVASVVFLVEWPCEIRVKMIEREFDWRNLRLLHGIGILAATLVAVCMAWLGAGTYALIAPGMLVSLPFIYDLFIRQRWRPTWQWSWKKYRPAFEFGVTRIGAGLSVSGRQLLESSVLAAALGFGPLGFMNRALGISQIACGKVATQLMYAIYPILTRLDTEDGRAKTAGNLVLRLVAWATVPMAVCLGGLALPTVEFVYGEGWLPVASLLPWALAWAVASAVVHVLYMLALARQRARLCLACDLLILGGTALNLFLTVPRGIPAYFAGLIVVQMTAAIVILLSLLRIEAVSVRGLLAAIFPPAASASASFAIASLAGRLITRPGGTDFLPAVVWGTIFCLSYLASLRVFFTAQLRQIVSYLPARAPISRLLLLAHS